MALTYRLKRCRETGFTQSSRIEYSLNGGFIYTDAIDNAAGVNCSDHEVNIKILLNDVLKAGKLTNKKRNELLASMEDEGVSDLVLDNNYQQTQSIDNMLYQDKVVSQLFKAYPAPWQDWFIKEKKVEFIPDDKVLKQDFESGVGLSAPEMSVVLAQEKILVKR